MIKRAGTIGPVVVHGSATLPVRYALQEAASGGLEIAYRIDHPMTSASRLGILWI